MPDIDKQDILAAWLEQSLTESQRERFEQLCLEDTEFAAQVEAANQFTAAGQAYVAQPPPHWDKDATFVSDENLPWWQKPIMPVFSMALSVLAIVLVVSGFHVRFEENGMLIGFQSNAQTQALEQKLEQRFDAFKQEQQLALTTYGQALQQQQLDASTQLTNYLLASSRKERREDFGEFIKFINEQRKDDQLFFARQLNQLQEDLYANPGAPQWSPSASLEQINE